MNAAALHTALRLGDDALILGQRLGEWCGHAPTLEIDLALANFGLDLIGQAQHFLGYAGELEANGRGADKLAFHRDVLDFTNCLLVEQPNGDFAQTIARQFLFSNWQELLFDQLAHSSDSRLAPIAAKAVKEVAYHARFASDWVVRLGDGTDESRARMTAGLDWMWRFTGELFEDLGPLIDAPALRPAWDARIDAALAEAGLPRPPQVRPVLGGRNGHHSEHLGHLLCAMQFLPRTYPDAVW
ncbi:MAG TPA: 1,2-phenylacetyl-CoA epoxidase subunit PaaC [Caulobacteraceae bacterium]